jgi:type IV pilus assembly protein PilP
MNIAKSTAPVLASLLLGCGHETPAEVQVQRRAAVSEPAATSPEPAGDYSYNPIGKRDPYRSFLPRERDPQLCVDWADPLQCWAVERLSLRGVVWGEHPRALIETPRGESFVVELGSYVGGNWGKVTHIDREAVVITEEYLVGDGELKVVPHRMELVPAG